MKIDEQYFTWKNVFHVPGYITGVCTHLYLNIHTQHKDDILVQRFHLTAEMMAR